MSKPKHKRCTVCGVVTSRYSHTTRQGPFSVKVWVRDERNGSVQGGDGKPYCQAHAEEAAQALAPAKVESVTEELLRRAAADESLDDATFTVLSRALRGVDPLGSEVPA